MARRLTNLVPGLALTALLLIALGGIYAAGLSITSPLAAAKPWVPSGSSPALLDVLPDLPVPFEPSALTIQPVFAVNRKPASPMPPAAPPSVEIVPERSTSNPADAAPPDYILAGILISRTDRRVLLKKHKNEKGLWLSRGQVTSDGWEVLTVEAEEATLSRSLRQSTLQFRSSVRTVAIK